MRRTAQQLKVKPMLSKAKGREFAVLNKVEDKETFSRIASGKQKVVFEYFDRKRAIIEWYNKWCDSDKKLVVKVWCDDLKKGNESRSFECIGIWDSTTWNWFGWLPEDKIYEEFDEPAGDHFVLYLGDAVDAREAKS